MNFVEADAQVEQIIQEAVAQLPAGAELKKNYYKSLACDDATGMDTGKVFAERSYDVTLPSAWPVDQAVDILKNYWKGRGYRVHRDDLDDPTIKAYFVENRSSGMSVGIKLYPRDNGTTDMVISGSSPCVWEFGTPNPD